MEVRHYVIPGQTLSVAKADEGETLLAFKERNGWSFKLPTIAVVDRVELVAYAELPLIVQLLAVAPLYATAPPDPAE